MLEDVYRITRDPQAIERAAVALWKEAARREETVRATLERLMGGRFQHIEELTRDVLRAPEPFIDLGFASDIHGAYTHLFTEYLIDLELGAGAGRRFRQAVANAVGPDVIDSAASGRRREFWEAAWDAVFDVTDADQINRPEVLGEILGDHLGLPRYKP
jgi:hypothetical protein